MVKNGLLLVNLGTPASPTVADVRRYLQQFLSDPNVIEMPAFVWQPILHHMILRRRAVKSAMRYRTIWRNGQSPLLTYTQQTTERVAATLPDWDVRYAMTYGKPTIATTLTTMQATCDQITVLPLYPQFSKSTHGGILEQVAATKVPARVVRYFYDQPAYLNLLARQINQRLAQVDYDALLVSYHGVPLGMIERGDPYQHQCEEMSHRLAQRLINPPALTKMVYQSKFGPAAWLQPYLNATLDKLPAQGVKRVLVVTPSFVGDCLETLDEDGVENRELFMRAGGERYDLLPPMNAAPEFCQFLGHFAQTIAENDQHVAIVN